MAKEVDPSGAVEGLEGWRRRMAAAGWTLTEEQWKAVQSPHRRIAVYAGPGTGKTTVLAARALFLIQVLGMRPADLLVTTFTREAAAELKERLRPWLPSRSLIEMEMGTLHSRMLRWWVRESGQVPRLLTPEEQRRLVEKAARRCGISGEEAAAALAVAKSRRPGRDQVSTRLREIYEGELRRYGAWDFDDILIQVHELLFEQGRMPPWKAVLVDEAQDLNEIQSILVEGLARDGLLFMIGDDDQSIYGFRGAVPAYFQGHLRRPDTAVFYLSVNHRSHQGLVEPCNRLIVNNGDARGKSIRALRQGPGPEVRLFPDEWEQDRWLNRVLAREALQGMAAVLARTHQQLQRALSRGAEGHRYGAIWLTFHGSKGREFDHVYILDAVEGSAPHYPGAPGKKRDQELEASLVEEERRLFYVAMTRARERLVILVPERIEGRVTRMSRFLAEAGLDEQKLPGGRWRGLRKILRRE
ncbi:UvrD-helicase domain-containing protein [Kyrpidia tusciae]|uniref:DNA 3'-5' helicase n=1 Tax=Kyrpidia tusciae (strain DSM 2912 / NBRC 15312 / T2) TaxID=562970 RepID=D5WQ77_KYRT2|nr:ATP-dependent helicase [Kyrpidia tusciae]ADG06486.1 UvrD/REP helicase [Kyrpidia tusciae DSM 2912]